MTIHHFTFLHMTAGLHSAAMVKDQYYSMSYASNSILTDNTNIGHPFGKHTLKVVSNITI